jgi:FHS family L-fucose permease-like MFS transporter
VGAEVSIGSFLVSFISQNDLSLDLTEASHFVAYYWGGAMIGRFLGASILTFVRGSKLLMIHGLAVVVLILLTILTNGAIAKWSMLSIGLFNSIMFPTIFSLSIDGLGNKTSEGSGILCMAIVGGALIPLFQGILADSIGLKLSYLLPVICYLFIAYFGYNRNQSPESTNASKGKLHHA